MLIPHTALKPIVSFWRVAGSKGVPGKNLKPCRWVVLGGAIDPCGASGAPSVDHVHVSTDDAGIADQARRFGAEVIDRPADLSGDGATSESGWLHALQVIEGAWTCRGASGVPAMHIALHHRRDIESCLHEMKAKGAACALSVIEDHSFLWGLDAAGLGQGINHDETQQRKRRQDLPPAFRESGAIYCVTRDAFVEHRAAVLRAGRALPCGSSTPLRSTRWTDMTLCTQFAAMRMAGPILTPCRLDRIAAVVMDFDGVHTDNLVLTDDSGRETVRTSREDGMGLEMLRKAGRIGG